MRTFTIGEVLNHLRDEFDDITISKIRFLEAEGLIHPDRTESGYRKFTPADVDRLRYVLRAQRDRYLPLKVIKEELDRIDAGLPVEAPTPTPPPAELATSTDGDDGDTSRQLLATSPTDVHLSATELADASGLTEGDVDELRAYGLLGAGPPYDGDDLRVARLAGQLLASGLEGRHLRMYRQFADREAALIEQLVAPLLRQRNPDSRRAAVEQAEWLAAQGDDLRQAVLGRVLRGLLRA